MRNALGLHDADAAVQKDFLVAEEHAFYYLNDLKYFKNTGISNGLLNK